jgi:hypothetical protein
MILGGRINQEIKPTSPCSSVIRDPVTACGATHPSTQNRRNTLLVESSSKIQRKHFHPRTPENYYKVIC